MIPLQLFIVFAVGLTVATTHADEFGFMLYQMVSVKHYLSKQSIPPSANVNSLSGYQPLHNLYISRLHKLESFSQDNELPAGNIGTAFNHIMNSFQHQKCFNDFALKYSVVHSENRNELAECVSSIYNDAGHISEGDTLPFIIQYLREPVVEAIKTSALPPMKPLETQQDVVLACQSISELAYTLSKPSSVKLEKRNTELPKSAAESSIWSKMAKGSSERIRKEVGILKNVAVDVYNHLFQLNFIWVQVAAVIAFLTLFMNHILIFVAALFLLPIYVIASVQHWINHGFSNELDSKQKS